MTPLSWRPSEDECLEEALSGLGFIWCPRYHNDSISWSQTRFMHNDLCTWNLTKETRWWAGVNWGQVSYKNKLIKKRLASNSTRGKKPIISKRRITINPKAEVPRNWTVDSIFTLTSPITQIIKSTGSAHRS